MRETDASAALSENEKEWVAILYYSTSVCIDDRFSI